jgi:predicted Zn-dependent peptidase
MLDSLLRRPLLEAEPLNAAIAALRFPKQDPWAAALEPEVWREARPSRDEVLAVYRRIVRPENVVLAFGGALEETALAAALRRFDDWSPKPETRTVRSWAVVGGPLLKSPNEVGTVELSGPEFLGTDPAFPVQLLATAALGVGSGSSIHKVAREANAWSYVQEGFLYPTPNGIKLRLIFAHAGEPGVLETIEPFRKGLAEDVQKWTQADRLRALAMLRNWLEHGIGNSAIWILPEGNRIESPEERLHLAAWWRMKVGSSLDTARLLDLLEKVSLDDLKSAAATAIEQASARVLVPSG